MTKEQLYWVAGIIEGEGTIYKHLKHKNWIVAVTSTDMDVLERLVLLTERGAIYRHWRSPKHKEAFNWRIGAQAEVKDLLKQIEPLMCSRRREKVLTALEDLKNLPKPKKQPYLKGISYAQLIDGGRVVTI